ncbi:MAG: alkaline phosphatase family protein [Acidobacteria bacterium]|nr:alkaline phosphatase family protein [Acidobacteriota bacterium]MBI3427964.1 alkaline phosphatase family protein [Acidobacteriota bacterium]
MKRFLRAPVVLLNYLFACCLILPLGARLNSGTTSSLKPRRLVLVLDGVPYQTIADLRAEGLFKHFQNPARMIATFPSSTNPSLVEILQADSSPGYEDQYYDRAQNRLIGGLQDRVRGTRFIRGTFRETFDYHASALGGSLAYVAAPLSTMIAAQFDLLACKQAFRRSSAPVFVGYLGATDSLTHLGGEQAIKSYLRTLDRGVEELIAESAQAGNQLEVELFSDHGNRYDSYKHVRLNEALAQAGFVTEKSLKTERSVVLPRYGLVGSAQLFTWPDNKVKVAEVCAATEGVDFALYYQADNSLALVSQRGRAKLSQMGERFKYEDLGGDPLRLNPILQAMRKAGRLDADGFADREAWYQATVAHEYVDPLRRLFDGFNLHVKNRADVIVSFADGWLIGSPFMSALAEMRATHGNLLRGETEGFAMSSRQALPAAVRGTELNRLFALDQRAKADLHLSGRGHCQAGPALALALTGKVE